MVRGEPKISPFKQIDQMLRTGSSKPSKAFARHVAYALAWILCYCTFAFASAVKPTDPNALAEPCSIVSLEEAQFVLGLPTTPRWHHR